MARPEDITRALLTAAPPIKVADALATRHRLEHLFPKVTDLREFVAPYEPTLASVNTSRLLGEALSAQLDPGRAEMVRKTVSSSAALAATRFEDAGELVKLGPRIAELYKAQRGLVDVRDWWRDPVRKFSQGMARLIEEQRQRHELTDAFVRAHGWPVPMHLPISAYRRIVGLAGAGKREVNRFMQEGFRPGTRAFSATAGVLVDSPAFESRRPLVTQALRAHRRGEWYLVINALLPLVEGVLVDYAFEDEAPPENSRPVKAMDRLREKDGVALGVAVNTLEVVLLSAGGNMALFAGFDPADYGAPGEPRALNRHAILHGAARRYGSEQNALRLVLLLAVMAEGFERAQNAAD